MTLMKWLSQKEREKRAKERRRFKRLKKLANYYKPRIIEGCKQQHMFFMASVAEHEYEGTRRVQKIHIKEIRANDEVIYYRIDPMRLPRGTQIADFRKPEVIETISTIAGRTLQFESSPECGTWIILEQEGAMYRIPVNFRYGDALNKLTQADPSMPPLTFVVGVGQSGIVHTEDFTEGQHLLVAGATGSGKSVFLNSILITLAWRNTPAELQFVMIDLKDGQELGDYDVLPHMHPDLPVAKSPQEALAALEGYRDTLEERGKKMGKEHCRNIKEWNRLFPTDKMPYIILVVDELAQLLKHPDKKLRSQSELVLGSVLATSRARGGHAILCTQTPRTDVVSGYLKTNVPMRICFSVPGKHDSITVIQSSHAWQLEPAGRAVYRHGSRLLTVQAPYISSGVIRRALKEIVRRGGKTEEKRREVELSEILHFALKERNGSLAWMPIYERFKPRLTQSQVKELVSNLEGRIVQADGLDYFVQESHGKGSIRKLVRHIQSGETGLLAAG